ncbi:TOM1-like protein 2 isoform X2 [Plodia interpunctella]|uniref:TOM1-like protein 2 isoform X2 n=1 Tax=Plodia interpunctella TaxID=58824 RepID=UPI002367667D|nr:TOM1-like protein 2 isoform X2 [Plodia interpunctella]
MSFFGVGNPFSTPVGQKIEQATDGNLPSENWALNMEICDIINSSTDGPKDAVKAIRRKLTQSAGKNYTVVMYTLTVLETCVKNCGKPFHVLVCHKEFISELVKLIGPKNDPPTVVQEKVLSLIQCWADAFQNQPDLQGVVQIYNELKTKGIEFPMTDLDAMAPIFTPQRSVPDGVDGPVVMSPQRAPPSEPLRPAQDQGSATVSLSDSQISKLRADLGVVEGNMAVMADMLNDLTAQPPAQQHHSDIELLNELADTLRSMQSRVAELVARLADAAPLTAELLHANDRLHNLLLRHSRLLSNRNAVTGAATPSAILGAAMGVPGSTESPKKTEEDALIDLSDDVPDIAKLSVKDSQPDKSPGSKDEFDMFAQSRNVSYDTAKSGGSSYAASLEPQTPALAAAAALRSAQPAATEANGAQESVTSSDFEKFLAERAAAAENLPNASENRGQSTPQGTPRHRQIKKEEQDSKFAL